MNSWNLIFATVIIFGTGVITGGLLVNHVEPHGKTVHRPSTTTVATNATNHPPAVHSDDFFNGHQPEIFKQNFVQKMDDELELSPGQRDAIHKIIADGQAQNHGLWDNWVGLSRQVSQDARLRIREQLNPDQRKQFEQLLKQMHPAGRKGGGTNGTPVLPPGTNDLVLKSTNVVSN